MSKDRRRTARTPKRLQVDFGTTDLEYRGYTRDISLGGLFLTADRLVDGREVVHLRVHVRKEHHFYAEGLVVHIKRVQANLRQIEAQGMGIRFLSPAEIVQSAFPRSARTVGLIVDCTSAQMIQQVMREQLQVGVLVVPVTDPIPTVGTVVEFILRLSYLPEWREARGVGRVCQVLTTGAATRRSAVLEIQDAAVLRATITGVACLDQVPA